MPGKLKSETELSAEFYRANQRRIESAVESARANYCGWRAVVADKMKGYDPDVGDDERARLEDMKTLIDAWDWLHATYHHFQKYHAADQDAFMGGQCYLGTACVVCEFTRSQQRAVDEYVADQDPMEND